MNPIKILILTANPNVPDHDSLRVDAEVRRIEEALQRSKYRDRFEITAKLAVRTTDLRRALLDCRPRIVHFSGHGTGEPGLILENDAGKLKVVGTEALAQLFGVFETGEIECVLLNACYSEIQATAIHQFVDCVIGMNQSIGDKAAVQFAEGFYDALGACGAYDEAFKIGCSAIALEGSSEHSTPVLKYRKRGRAALSVEQRVLDPGERQAAVATEVAAPAVRSSSSQSIGKISIGGNSKTLNAIQAEGDVTIDQSRTETQAAHPDSQAALAALVSLKQAISITDAIDETEKAMVAIPLQKLEAELKKPQPDYSVVNRMIATLKKALDGVSPLAGAVDKVATLAAKAKTVLR